MNSSVGRFFCLVTRQVAYSQNCNGFSIHLLKKFEWKLLNSKIQLLYSIRILLEIFGKAVHEIPFLDARTILNEFYFYNFLCIICKKFTIMPNS